MNIEITQRLEESIKEALKFRDDPQYAYGLLEEINRLIEDSKQKYEDYIEDFVENVHM